MGGRQKLISLYTLRTLCFSRVMLQPGEEEKARKKSLHRSLVVVAFLWSAVFLIVAVNIDTNGAHRFYGPAGYCKPCTSVWLEGLIDLTSPRVLDSAHVCGPANGSRLCLYMGNCHIQHRDLFSGFPLFQGLHHDKRVEDMRVS
jgi:hypothetical protein